MIVQFFGLDQVTRTHIAKAFASGSRFYCSDRELPMASLEAQYARWLRTIAGVADRNNIKEIVIDGYFPTKESRSEFKDGKVPSHIFTVWIDTIDEKDAVYPESTHNTPDTDFRWEAPSEDEYHLRIDNSYKNLESLDVIFAELEKYENQ